MFRAFKQLWKCDMGTRCHWHDEGEPVQSQVKASCGELRYTSWYQRVRCCACGTVEEFLVSGPSTGHLKFDTDPN